MDFRTIVFEKLGAVARITANRPQVLMASTYNRVTWALTQSQRPPRRAQTSV